MAGTMSGLSVGVSGLQKSQTALNTTAHNLSNVNTSGYTRQQVLFGDSSYNNLNVTSVGTNQVGIGVDITQIRRERDDFLDKTYRRQTGRQAFYETQYEAIYEIQNDLGELFGENYGNVLNELWTSLQELKKAPDDSVYRASVVENAVNFTQRSKAVYDQLKAYQENLNTKIQTTVDRINTLANTIYDMNKKISQVESTGVENANDYRDTRDSALDELSTLIKIEYEETTNGVVNVFAEGVPLVYSDFCLGMSTEYIEGTALLKPVWDFLDDKEVFNLDADIKSSDESDCGKLKSMLLARGDGALTYKDLDEDQANGTNKIQMNTSSISATMAVFDRLVNGIVTQINDMLCPNTTQTNNFNFTLKNGQTGTYAYDQATQTGSITYTDPNTGKTLKVDGVLFLDTDKASFSQDGSVQGTELFARADTERYTVITGSDGNTYYLYNAPGQAKSANPDDLNGLYTSANLTVRESLQDNTALLPFTKANGDNDQERIDAICKLWEDAFATVGNETTTEYRYTDYYQSFVNRLGNLGSTYNNVAENQSSVSSTIDDKRQGVAGVNSDDELTNMIKFQNAYNAASRYINVVSEMIEHIVTQLGSR